jgi:hypothetical protein
MCRVSERLPNLFRRVAQLPGENKSPLVTFISSYFCPAGGTWRVWLTVGHFFFFLLFGVGSSM